MTMPGSPTLQPSPGRPPGARAILRLAAAGLLGVGCALLVSCGSSGSGLIPTADAGPLQSDFETVAVAARAGNGNCAATEAAIAKTERDFAALPSQLNAGLRERLQQGISNLSEHARTLCQEPLTGTSTTTTAKTTTTTTPTTTTTTPATTTSPTTATTPITTPVTTPTGTTPTTSGGTVAPSGEGPSTPGGGQGGAKVGPGGGVGAGEATK